MDRGNNTPAEQPVGGWLGSIQRHTEQLDRMPRMRQLAIAALGVWTSGVLVANAHAVGVLEDKERSEIAVACSETDISCLLTEAGMDVPPAMRRGPLVTEEVERSLVAASEDAVTTTQPELTTTTTVEQTISQQLGLEVDPLVETSIAAMELTPEGYDHFIRTIDTSQLSFASQFREFNRDLLRLVIPQHASEVFVLHFTVKYANDEPGFNDMMIGDFNVSNLISSMAGRYGHDGQCCGINWMIGRHADTYQTAPLDAKLNHNPPYDDIATGVEIEASEQATISTDQYESAAYLAIAVLDTQGLLGSRPLAEILQGHGEMRDRIIEEWNSTRPPHAHLAVRDDFNFPETALFRHFVQSFLDQHPELIGMRPLAHLA